VWKLCGPMSIALRRNGSRRRKIGDSTARWDHSQATGIAAGPDNGLLTFSVTPVDRTSKLLSFHEPQQHAGCWVPQVPPLHLGILTLISAHVVLGLSFGSRARSSKAEDGDSSGRLSRLSGICIYPRKRKCPCSDNISIDLASEEGWGGSLSKYECYQVATSGLER
jgi:hypothetical protein